MSDTPPVGQPRRVEALLAGFTRIRLLNIREIRTHRLRLFTSLAVVIVSSALLVAVLGGTFGSTSESVRAFNNAISGSADLEVAAIADSGVDQSLAGQIRREVDGAKAVVPMIRGSVVVDDSSIPLIGSDQRVTSLSGSLRSAVQQENSGTIDFDRLRSGVFVGPGLGLEAGQKLTVNGVDVEVLEVIDNEQAAGLNNGRFMFAYLDLAQRLVGLEGRLDSILIVTEPGGDRRRIGAIAGRGDRRRPRGGGRSGLPRQAGRGRQLGDARCDSPGLAGLAGDRRVPGHRMRF